MAPGGKLCLAEDLPGAGSRPLDLIDPSGAIAISEGKGEGTEAGQNQLKQDSLLLRAREAEAKVYAADEALARRESDFSKIFGKRGAWNEKTIEIRYELQELPISEALIARWFDSESGYARRLEQYIAEEDVRRIRSRFGALAGGRAPAWKSAALILEGHQGGQNSTGGSPMSRDPKQESRLRPAGRRMRRLAIAWTRFWRLFSQARGSPSKRCGRASNAGWERTAFTYCADACRG